MIDQNRIITQKFNPEDMIEVIGHSELNAANARLNQVSGPAFTVYLDKKPVGCGGVRIAGVGEAWVAYSQEALKHLNDLIRNSEKGIEKIIRDEHIWRLWAEISASDDKHRTFLKHMKFNPIEAFVR